LNCWRKKPAFFITEKLTYFIVYCSFNQQELSQLEVKMVIKPPDYKFCPFCTETLSVKIEENRERKYCLSCGWQYFPSPGIAVVAVITHENKVLMVQRNRMPYAGTWMFPAGFLEFGEEPLETYHRELKEETGLDIVFEPQLLCIKKSLDDPRASGHLVFFFKVEAAFCYVTENRDTVENRKVAWKSIENPPLIGFQTHREVIQLLQSERRKR